MEKFFGPMEQIGIVVDDFNDPINHWTKNLNVGPFIILEHLDLKDVYYKGNNANIDFSVALAYSGDIQIELIKQHCETPSIYNDYVNNKKNTETKKELSSIHESIRLIQDENQWFHGKKGE